MYNQRKLYNSTQQTAFKNMRDVEDPVFKTIPKERPLTDIQNKMYTQMSNMRQSNNSIEYIENEYNKLYEDLEKARKEKILLNDRQTAVIYNEFSQLQQSISSQSKTNQDAKDLYNKIITMRVRIANNEYTEVKKPKQSLTTNFLV
jgi:uncharacterized protein (DUF3084 family)